MAEWLGVWLTVLGWLLFYVYVRYYKRRYQKTDDETYSDDPF